MDRYDKLRGRYYLRDVIKRLKAKGETNEIIAEILDCSISTIKYCLRNGESFTIPPSQVDTIFGTVNPEFRRVAAIHKCKEFLTLRGWQVGESDPKCIFDVFAYKKHETITIQVRSSQTLSRRGWPKFKTARLHFNTKVCRKIQFEPGDFNHWFFYGPEGDAWMIPFEKVLNRAEISMEGFDEFYLG